MFFNPPVTPDNGHKAIVGIASRYVTHKWDVQPEHVIATIQNLESSGNQIYFSLAGFSCESRKAKYATHARALWLDIDAGEAKYLKHGDKVYMTKLEALTAVTAMCGRSGFQEPTHIISSGAGLHVYWAFDKDISAVEWVRAAKWFMAIVAEYGVRQDTSRTAEIASILRVPGTLHTDMAIDGLEDGDDEEFEREVKRLGGTSEVYTYTAIVEALANSGVPEPVELPVQERNQTGEIALSYFKNIGAKSIDGYGCQQIAALLASGGNVEEPLWRAGLSIIKSCTDTDEEKEVFYTLMSDGHPEYSLGATLEKANSTQGAVGCIAFENLNPDGCKGCPFRNTEVNNPRQLGYSSTVTRREQQAVLVKPELPVLDLPMITMDELKPAVQELVESDVEKIYATFADRRNMIMFTSSDNIEYRMGKWWVNEAGEAVLRKGAYNKIGVTQILDKEIKSEDGGTMTVRTATVICDINLFMYDRITDSGVQSANERFWLRVESPLDEPRKFTLEGATLAAGGDKLRVALSSYGVQLTRPLIQTQLLTTYLASWTNHLRSIKKARISPANLGWTPTGSFIYGATEYTKTGELEVPTSDKTQRFAAGATKRGTVQGWSDSMGELYPNGQKGVEAYQFMVLSGFAAPLYSAVVDSTTAGGVINFYSPHSGGGKSTAHRAGASIYGDPDSFHAAHTTTAIAKIELMGLANSLPIFIDEVTLASAGAISEFIYMSTQGKGKDKMVDGGKSLRQNETTWKSFVLTSANVTLMEVVASYRASSEGIAKRVLEIEAPSLPRMLDKEQSDAVMGRAKLQHGVVGDIWLKHLVRNMATTSADMIDTRIRIDSRVGLNTQDRFWSNMASSIISAGRQAYELGLHPFDMDALEEWLVLELRSNLDKVVEHELDPSDMFAMFLSSHQDKILWTSSDNVPDYAIPRASVVGRADLHKGAVWIGVEAIKTWCSEKHFSPDRIKHLLLSSGGKRKRKRLLCGTSRSSASANVWAYEINLSNPSAAALFGDGLENNVVKEPKGEPEYDNNSSS